MKHPVGRIAALLGGTAMIVLQTAPVAAEGTPAGRTITNTATVNFRVGGIDQTAETASDTFTVDRRVNFVATLVSTPAPERSPGRAAR